MQSLGRIATALRSLVLESVPDYDVSLAGAKKAIRNMITETITASE